MHRLRDLPFQPQITVHVSYTKYMCVQNKRGLAPISYFWAFCGVYLQQTSNLNLFSANQLKWFAGTLSYFQLWKFRLKASSVKYSFQWLYQGEWDSFLHPSLFFCLNWRSPKSCSLSEEVTRPNMLHYLHYVLCRCYSCCVSG